MSSLHRTEEQTSALIASIIQPPGEPMRWPHVMETTASKLVAPTLANYTVAAILASLAVVSVIALLGGVGFAIAAAVNSHHRARLQQERSRKGKAPLEEDKWDRMDYVTGGAGPSKAMSTVVEDLEIAMESDCRRRAPLSIHAPQSSKVSSHPVYFASAAEPGVASGYEATLAPSWSGMSSAVGAGQQQGPVVGRKTAHVVVASA